MEGGNGGIAIPFHAQILTKFTRHVLNQSLSEKPQGNEIFTTKHKQFTNHAYLIKKSRVTCIQVFTNHVSF